MTKKIKLNGKRIEQQKWSLNEKLFLILIVLVLFLGSMNLAKAKGWLIPEQPQLEIEGNVIKLDSMSLEQKIAQMLVVHGSSHNFEAWKSMQIGGIHIFALENADLYKEIIQKYQSESQIPLLVSVDLEGCWNPFGNFRNFTAVSEIKSVGEAFQAGSDEGKFLKELGFKIDYAPVVDLKDEIWNCRSFPGDEKSIGELSEAYILGLQSQGLVATAKHYPGKTLVVRDPHKFLVQAEISAEDIYPYNYLKQKKNVNSIMVSHVISSGKVDSEGIPAVVSKKVIDELKQDYSGLVISDEINMLGLKNFYANPKEMYLAVFKAGNDIILDFSEDPNEVYALIEVVKEAVEKGEIPEEQIDNSVRKILELKGMKVE